MDSGYLLARLAANAEVFAAFMRGLPESQVRWKPVPDSWSILEVLCHLQDEEREDFRERVNCLLREIEPWPPIDPEGWVKSRGYNQRDSRVVLDGFLAERRKSLAWLATIQQEDWLREVASPGGPLRPEDMLAAWVAHDQLHIRQLNELQWKHLSTVAPPFSLRYAGGW